MIKKLLIFAAIAMLFVGVQAGTAGGSGIKRVISNRRFYQLDPVGRQHFFLRVDGLHWGSCSTHL